MRNAVILSLLTAAGLLAADPFAGTWQLNFGKSHTTMKNPPPAPKSVIVIYAPDGDRMKVNTEVTHADGRVTKAEHVVIYDGQEHPLFTGAPAGLTLTAKRVDQFTEESVQKKDGKTMVTTRRVVSADGKTMTSTSKATAPTGEETETVTVYDKV